MTTTREKVFHSVKPLAQTAISSAEITTLSWRPRSHGPDFKSEPTRQRARMGGEAFVTTRCERGTYFEERLREAGVLVAEWCADQNFELGRGRKNEKVGGC